MQNDFNTYKEIYNKLMTNADNVVGSDVDADERKKTIDTINKFLETYPKSLPPAPDSDPWTKVPVDRLTKKTIDTTIDIINDISTLISNRQQYSNTEYRRQFVDIFFKPERRLYVGFILVFLSFVLYFIDSSA
jgi:hypothetical protein